MHSLERTSPKGGPFIGTCTKCGMRDIPAARMSEPCAYPPLFVQKVMLRDGHYGEQERANVLRHDGELTRHHPAPDEPEKGLG